jgi:lipopolysaccharide/colanic/teichoic acid biosynthesis glycosyltransferase
LKKWIIALLCSFGVGIILFYFVPIFGISPKLNLIIQIIGFGIFSFLFRRTIYTLFSRAITEPVIFIGGSLYLSELEKTIGRHPQMGLQIIGHFKTIKDINIKLSEFKNLVIILDKNAETQDQNILNFYKKGIEIIDTAKAYEKYLYKIPVEYIDLSFIIENVETKKDILYGALTFVINIIFAILLLIITSPILLIAIIARLIEDGRPIFIKQKRVGLNGKIFDLYKLRSMIVLSPDGSAEKDCAVWATGHDDERITKVGKVLRDLHIDEIPQMINILKGDISLVGPRPERPEFVSLLDKDIPYYSFRHIIRPGFTGWAQIKYFYANTVVTSKEKFEYDLYYIKNRNIFIDLGVIIRTIQIIFTH